MKLIMERFRRFVESNAVGQCYPFAIEMSKKSSNEEFNDLSKFKVVHGRITDKFSGESVLHAWVEKGGMVFDWQTSSTKPDGIPKADYYDMFQPEPHEEYTAEETMIKCVRTGQKGPWTDQLQEAIELDIDIGDVVLGGKYKNKRVEVKEIGTDDIGQPTINGKTLLKFRIEKQLPDNKKSKKTLDAEKEEAKEE